jgi:hypothetical protein
MFEITKQDDEIDKQLKTFMKKKFGIIKQYLVGAYIKN